MVKGFSGIIAEGDAPSPELRRDMTSSEGFPVSCAPFVCLFQLNSIFPPFPSSIEYLIQTLLDHHYYWPVDGIVLVNGSVRPMRNGTMCRFSWKIWVSTPYPQEVVRSHSSVWRSCIRLEFFALVAVGSTSQSTGIESTRGFKIDVASWRFFH
jgi:hypothetical protein